MKLGIIGLPGAGKSTVFEALTHAIAGPEHRGQDRIATVQVPDERVDALKHMFNPQKTIYARVEYFLPGLKKDSPGDASVWTAARDCDALLHVIRNHCAYGFEKPSPTEDFIHLDQELILADLVVAEKRLERIRLDHQRGKKMDPEEHDLLAACCDCLEAEIPLRNRPDLATAHRLRGFAFLSAKPVLILFNNDDDDEHLPAVNGPIAAEACQVIRGRLEQELARMSPEESAEFLTEFNIPVSATDRVIRQSYAVLDLISFFTVVSNEVRAWAIKAGTPAREAAGHIHTDMQKGFIRAEVVSFKDLMETGSYADAKKQGTVRLEGKAYEVQDGDVVQFRFNV
jgi:GTP-binding protein YchF